MDEDYQLRVLTIAINKYLDEIISFTQESLKFFSANRDHIVWELATKIYTQSGHKVKLTIIRDIVNSRIEDLSYKLMAEQKRIEKEQAQMAEEARQIEQKRLRKQGKLKLTKQERIEQEYLVLEKFEGDKSKVLIFIKVQKIISEVLSIHEDYIDLEFNLFDEFGSHTAFLETLLALEEGFDIEISDEDSDSFGVMQEIVNYIHQTQASR